MRFMDAYRKGLTGSQAAWACKKYSGHRTLPHGILAELDRELTSANSNSATTRRR